MSSLLPERFDTKQPTVTIPKALAIFVSCIQMRCLVHSPDGALLAYVTGIVLRTTSTDMHGRQKNFTHKIKQRNNQAQHGCNK